MRVQNYATSLPRALFSLPPCSATRPALTDAGVAVGAHWDRSESSKSRLVAGVKTPKAGKAAGSSLPAGSPAPGAAHLPLALARLHPEEQEKDVQRMDFHTTRHGMPEAHQSPPSLVQPVLSHKPLPCLSHVPCLALFSLPLCSAMRPALTDAGVAVGAHWDRSESSKSRLAAGVKTPKAGKAAGSSLPAGIRAERLFVVSAPA